MLRYLHLAVVLVAVYLPDQTWALPLLAGVNVVFALMFFYLCFSLLAGLKVSELNSEIEISESWSSRVVQMVATIVLFMTGDMTYMLIAAFTAPWIVINTITDIFATLLKLDIIAITDKEE